MKNLRKRTFVVVLFAVLFSVFGLVPFLTWGCQSAYAAEKMVLKCAGQNPVEHQGTQAIEKIAEEIKKRTDGRIEIRTFPASQLGDYTLVYEEMMKGTIEMSLGAPPSQYDNRLQLSVAPFIVTDWAQVREEYMPGGWVFNKMKEFNSPQGVVFLGFNTAGFGGIGSTKAINDVLDPNVPKNILMRVAPLEITKIMMTGMSYPTVSVPWADLYQALQTGVADAWVGGNPTYSYTMFKDVLKYYYQLNLYMECESYMISQKVWDKLSDEDKKIFEEVIAEVSAGSFAIGEAEDKHYMDLMRQDGWQVFEYTAEELEPLQKHFVEKVWDQMAGTLTPELVAEMKEHFGSK